MVRLNAEIGTRYALVGMLHASERGLVLQVDDGGVWALDADPEHRGFAGRRVRVDGVRSGFDRIDVERLRPA